MKAVTRQTTRIPDHGENSMLRNMHLIGGQWSSLTRSHAAQGLNRFRRKCFVKKRCRNVGTIQTLSSIPTKSVGGNTSNSSSITSLDNSSFSDPQVTLSKAVAHWWIHAMIFHGVRVEAKPAPLRLHSRPAHGSRTTLAAMPAQVQTKE